MVRLVEKYARRMQIQERLIKEIADEIMRRGVKGVLVVGEAKNMFMKMLGVRNGSSILTAGGIVE